MLETVIFDLAVSQSAIYVGLNFSVHVLSDILPTIHFTNGSVYMGSLNHCRKQAVSILLVAGSSLAAVSIRTSTSSSGMNSNPLNLNLIKSLGPENLFVIMINN